MSSMTTFCLCALQRQMQEMQAHEAMRDNRLEAL